MFGGQAMCTFSEFVDAGEINQVQYQEIRDNVSEMNYETKMKRRMGIMKKMQ